MFYFEKLTLEKIDEFEFNSIATKSVFTTIPWIKYILEDNSNASPIVLRITDDNDFVGYFSSVFVKKFGFRIIGSPFRGWSTCYMGFDVVDNEQKLNILKELKEYLYVNYKYHYLEIIDRDIPVEEAKSLYTVKIADTLELDIDKTDDELFKVFKTDCRNFIRQFERRGATLEIAEPNDEFAEEYYNELKDVFAKQNLVPTYTSTKVKTLLRNLKDSNEVLCLRVKDPDGNKIATSIFFGFNNKFFFWGGASLRGTQHYRPNEYMIWTAIKYWRGRGVKTFDMVGVRDYKKKFGSEYREYPCIIITSRLLLFLRDNAERLFFIGEKVLGKLKKRK